MSKMFKRIAIFLCIVFIAPTILSCLPSINITPQANAAVVDKPKLSPTKGTTGVESTPEYICIEFYNTDATYVFSSANKDIATVGEYGEVFGHRKGKTTITLKETLNGTTTEVGSYSVNVVTAQLKAKKLEIGVNASGYTPMLYKNKKATYQYKSSNSKVVKVGKDGFLNGLKLGKATISVSETYKGKMNKIGSFTVNVVKSKLAEKKIEIPIAEYSCGEVIIDCRNSKAKYKFTSSNSKIASVDKDGFITGAKEGTATISVSETYNKVTKDVGSLTVNVVGSSISSETKSIEIGINSSNYLPGTITILNQIYEASYTCEVADSTIVAAYDIEDEYGLWYCINGVKLGTTTITVYEDYKGTKRNLGTVEVTVKEFPVTSMKFADYFPVNDQNIVTKSIYLGYTNEYDSLLYHLDIAPLKCTTPVTFTSSDPSIVKIDEKGILTSVKEGSAEITATCGSFTDKIIIVVKPSEAYFIDYNYEPGSN